MVECVVLDAAPLLWLPREMVPHLVALGRVCERQPQAHAKRRAWCERALSAAQPMLERLGIYQPPERLQRVEFGVLEDPTSLGRCRIDGRVARITISTQHAAVLEDPRAVAHVCLHELLHSADDNRSRDHGGQWKFWANLLGMEPTGCTKRNTRGERVIDRVLRAVGPLPPLDDKP